MNDKLQGLIFNIQRFVLHDGPGIRTTVFFKGCPLHCLWCHNPEGMNSFPELLYRKFQCIHCKSCIQSCPINAINDENETISIKRDSCDFCGTCVDTCNSTALEMCGQYMLIDDVLQEILSDKIFYDESNGGLTISGGEPFMQFDFLKALLLQAKNHDLHVCLDTTGHVNSSKLKEIMDLVDIFLYDVKSLDPHLHEELTGKPNTLILDNLKLCLDENCDIVVRIPIIPCYNFKNLPTELENHVLQLHDMGVNKFELIPYHKFGEQKYAMLGRDFTLHVEDIDRNLIFSLVDKLREKKIVIKVSEPILT